ncbi:cytochrome c biogenesis protein CcdA [Candidatus Chlorohelix sp.]|uniref:cytochrome c biogenesis CcdA family protein n=1 Tax=Candidatus Chlorohelix sp. TaxID=3139201 RepID=UPI003037FF75
MVLQPFEQQLVVSLVAQTASAPDYIATFFEGLLSFLAPCVLPLVPGYLSYISGVSVAKAARTVKNPAIAVSAGSGNSGAVALETNPIEAEQEIAQISGADIRRVLFSSLLFVAGFTTIFILFFGFFNLITDIFGDIRTPVRIAAGLLVIFFGLHFLGIFRIGFLDMERRFNLNRIKRASYIGAYFLGGAFAFGWTPCVGPFLTAAIFTAEQSNGWEGATLMLVYSAGLGIPFILAGLFFNRMLGFIARLRRHYQIIEIASGILLLLVGLLLITNNLSAITQELSRFRYF